MAERPLDPVLAQTSYCRTRVRTVAAPLTLGVALARGTTEPFVLYERAGTVTFAAGAVAELVLDHREIRFRRGTNRTLVPIGPEPLQQVAELLAGSGIEGWRAYGWVAFELSHLLHGRPADAGPGPLLHLVIPEREVRCGDGVADLRFVQASDLTTLTAQLAAAPASGPDAVQDLLDDPAATASDDAGAAAYQRAVAAAVRDIRARRFQKVILSRVVPVPHEIDLVATYEVGRRGNTPARSFLLELGGLRAAGFSPETVVEVTADGTVSTQPLAGTRALSGDPLVDHGLRAELLADPKEVFEHAVSVQAAQEEVRALCRPGSVHVDEFMTIKERGSVQHLASRVSGQLTPDRNGWHALAGLFPAITASGSPKAAACAAIRHYEDAPRGLYSGAVVVADADGGLDAALVLRSVYQQDGRTWLRAGAGVVEQSTPEREFEETREKLRSTSRFLVPGPVAVVGVGA